MLHIFALTENGVKEVPELYTISPVQTTYVLANKDFLLDPVQQFSSIFLDSLIAFAHAMQVTGYDEDLYILPITPALLAQSRAVGAELSYTINGEGFADIRRTPSC